MPGQRRSFSPEFKPRVVNEVELVQNQAAEARRQLRLSSGQSPVGGSRSLDEVMFRQSSSSSATPSTPTDATHLRFGLGYTPDGGTGTAPA